MSIILQIFWALASEREPPWTVKSAYESQHCDGRESKLWREREIECNIDKTRELRGEKNSWRTLREDEDRTTVDLTVAGDDTVTRVLLLLHSEVVATVSHKLVVLLPRTCHQDQPKNEA